MTEFEIKKREKEKNVEELREKLSDLNIKEAETKGNIMYTEVQNIGEGRFTIGDGSR